MPGSCVSLPSLLTIPCGDLSPTSGPGVPHPMALSLEAASGVSGSYSVSGSPVGAPAPHQAGILGLISSFTPLRMAGPSQGSTETLDPDSARSSPFEERRRRVKEEGKVNVTGGEVGGLGAGDTSARLPPELGMQLLGLVGDPAVVAPARGCADPRDGGGALVLAQSRRWMWGGHGGTPDPHARNRAASGCFPARLLFSDPFFPLFTVRRH